MTSGANRRAALAALDRGRGALGKLDSSRPPEERRNAIRESWGATEVALRALLGGSPLAGQPLVRALREQGMLTLEQAHSLVDFASARERTDREGYDPTEADSAAARTGFRTLDDALNEAAVIEARPADDDHPASRAPAAVQEPTTVGAGRRRRSPSAGWILAAIVLLLVVLPALGWWYWSTQASPPARVSSAAALYQQGDREGARRAFEELANNRPNLVLPHVYLGRIARDNGDMATAGRELQTAIRLDPEHPVALREMGSYLLANGQPDVARRFYVRALSVNSADTTSMGYLGCALARMGRIPEAQSWLQRAGPGDWSQCVQVQPPPPPAALR